jgi:hypothetical protein
MDWGNLESRRGRQELDFDPRLSAESYVLRQRLIVSKRGHFDSMNLTMKVDKKTGRPKETGRPEYAS